MIKQNLFHTVTVHRFKGRAADAVVLVGVPQILDTAMERNRVFVGMTRGAASAKCPRCVLRALVHQILYVVAKPCVTSSSNRMQRSLIVSQFFTAGEVTYEH